MTKHEAERLESKQILARVLLRFEETVDGSERDRALRCAGMRKHERTLGRTDAAEIDATELLLSMTRARELSNGDAEPTFALRDETFTRESLPGFASGRDAANDPARVRQVRTHRFQMHALEGGDRRAQRERTIRRSRPEVR